MSRLTDQNVALAREIISRYPKQKSALIPLVHLSQEQNGYVTEEAMRHVAELIDVTPAEVYGTASFYEMFRFEPTGKYLIAIDTVDAGIGDRVLVLDEGNGARQILDDESAPVRSMVVGVVDALRLE